MTDELAERLERCYTGVIHDVMRALGLRHFTLPPELRPLLPEKRMAGPAFTIEGMVVPMADPDRTLLAWTGLLSAAPARHVWVCQPNDRTVAHMGELSAETLSRKGLRGCVVDGGVRDTEFLIRLGFQTWSRFFTPRDIVGWWLPKGTRCEIRIGDVTIAPGDYVLGDRDGMVCVPRERVAEVLDKAEAAMATENLVRTAILSGMDPQEAYRRHGKF
jgi:4-hydroxy-4-methyl-2-oxoglutarate aldolase